MVVRQEQIQAVLEHGVLEITLLKEEKAKPTRVQVEVPWRNPGSRRVTTSSGVVDPEGRDAAQQEA
jgi:hypothetical protein